MGWFTKLLYEFYENFNNEIIQYVYVCTDEQLRLIRTVNSAF